MNDTIMRNRRPSTIISVIALMLFSIAGFFTSGCSQPNGDDTPKTSQTGTNEKTSGPISQPASSKAEVLVLEEGKSEQELRNPWSPEGIADFELIERSGKKVTRADLLGKPWVACFVFTNCVGPCLNISRQMHDLQNWAKETDVRLVSISVDPKNDTPERLREYADILAADKDRWLFLTGDKETIYRLARDDFQTTVGELAGEPFHTSNLFLVDEQGRIIGKYNATEAEEMTALREDLQQKFSGETGPLPAEKPQLENPTRSPEDH